MFNVQKGAVTIKKMDDSGVYSRILRPSFVTPSVTPSVTPTMKNAQKNGFRLFPRKPSAEVVFLIGYLLYNIYARGSARL